MSYAVILSGIEQATQSILEQCSYIIYSPSEYKKQNILQAKNAFGQKFCLFLPIMAREEDVSILKELIDECQIDCVMSNNLFGLELGAKRVFLGYGHNILNTAFVESGIYNIEAYTQGVECSGILDVKSYVYAYGYVPLMTYAHCPHKNILNASCGEGCGRDLKYKDQKGYTFTLKRYRIRNCYFQLLNSVPMYINQLNKEQNKLLDFSACTKAEAQRVFEAFVQGKKLEISHTKGLMGKKLR